MILLITVFAGRAVTPACAPFWQRFSLGNPLGTRKNFVAAIIASLISALEVLVHKRVTLFGRRTKGAGFKVPQFQGPNDASAVIAFYIETLKP
jgi:hypothetical protein